MPLHPSAVPLQVEPSGDATRARITTAELNETNVLAVARALFGLVEGQARPQLCLALGEVRYLTSTALGHLVALHKRVRAAGGRLVHTEVTAPVHEIIRLTRLHEVLDVRPLGTEGNAPRPLAS
jgi:anti-sigma B factor antagonist